MNRSEEKNSWEWVPCTFDMKRIVKEAQTSWNLSPQISLKIPTDSGTVDPQINLRIEQSRGFIYTEGLGWNWHKSWNLPDIGIELEIVDPVTLERLAPPNNIYCKLQIVKPTMSPMKTFHLLEVGAKGNQKVDMENGKCIFSGLKFNTTSYNHEHQKFHIVITLYLCQSKFEFPQILDSRISPPIFVDSRKSARDIVKQKVLEIVSQIQKLQSYFDPFEPSTLDKQFVIIKPSNQEQIKNSLEGLLNYFTAPNIRHKVKHPLFLLLKFSSCVQMYVNSSKIKLNLVFQIVMQPEQLVENLQQVLSASNALQGVQKIEQKQILLCITMGEGKSQANTKKIMEFLEPLNNDCVQVIIDALDLPKGFIQLANLDEIKKAYNNVYHTLVKFKDEQYDQEQLEEEYNAKITEKKKKKENKEPEIVVNSERIRKIIHIQGPQSITESLSDQVKIEYPPPERLQCKLPQEPQQHQLPPQTQNLAFNPIQFWQYLQKVPQLQ